MRRKLPQVLAAGLVLATATGCTYKDFPRLGMPTPVTDEAPRILSLWQGSWAAALATGVLVWGLIIWSVIFHRRSRTKVEVPAQTRYNMPIEALYTIVPFIIIAVLFYFTARDESELLKTSKKPDHIVNVVGFQWSWAFNYLENVDGSKSTTAIDSPELSTASRTSGRRVLRPAPTASTTRARRVRRNPQNGNPGPDPVAAQGRDGPVRPDVA